MAHASRYAVFCTAVSLSLGSVDGLKSRSTASSLQERADSQSSSIYETRFPNVTWDNANWQLTSKWLDQGHYQSRISLANGYIGINLANLGPFFEVDESVDGDNIAGWPLFDRRQSFATVAGFWDSQPTTNGSNFPWLYQYGWDSAISGVPHWAGIVLDLGNGVALRADSQAENIHNFTSSLEMKRSVMNWAYTWTPPNHPALDVSFQMFLHKVNVTQAFVAMNVTARQDAKATVVNVLNGDCALRTNETDKGVDGDFMFSAVNPWGINNVTAFVYTNMSIHGAQSASSLDTSWTASYVGQNKSSIAGAVGVTLSAGQTVSVFKYVGIASSDGFAHPKQVAKTGAMSGMQAGYARALHSHTAEWAALFPASSVDDFSFPENGTLPDDANIVESQIMAVANPFYLLQNTISENATSVYQDASINDHSISVGGLGSDAYAGQIFWDAEIWMQPGLVATFPYAAQGIANYRIARAGQAHRNIETAYQSSKNDTYFSPEGAVFPWTSGRFGNCTATGPCWDYEYHLMGDIGQEFVNYWITSGDTEFFHDNMYPLYQSMARLYSDLLEKNGSRWALTNMTDPDEFANMVDNGGFTMPLIAETLQYANNFREYFNDTANDTWTSQAENVYISRNEDAGIILEYTGMNGSIEVKQADVVLVTYPLSYRGQNYSAEDSLSDLEYYAAKQSAAGPAMTYGIFSIVANEVSPSGCSSYTYQQWSTQPYTRAPWFQLGEQLQDNFQENGGFHPAFPFHTGHGGAHQVALFGYLGFRLRPDWVLHVDPSLPPQIPQLRYRTFHWQGWPISAFSNQTHTTLFRDPNLEPASGAKPNSTFSESPIPVQVGPVNGEQTSYKLPLNGTIVIPNRLNNFNITTPGNVAQCQPATSDSDVVPGQFPISAVDGTASTKWQPAQANATAQLTVQLPLGHRVLGFTFDWGQAPAYNYTIFFHNDSNTSPTVGTATAVTVVDNYNVSISDAYDPKAAADIVKITGNSSSLWLNETHANGPELPADLWTSRFATLAIWGSWYNSSFTVQNMSGTGATVAEWNVIVEDNGSSGRYGNNMLPRHVKRSSDFLERAGRYLNSGTRR